MKKKFTPFLVIGLFVLLLTFPSASLDGAKNGLMLWFETVLPTLLPFIIVSNLMIKLNVTNCLTTILYPVFGKIFGVSKPACYPIVLGMLSGYPVGAKACADLVTTNQITVQEGQYLLCFCNNASPMFVLSFISIHCLGLPNKAYWILGIIIVSSILTGYLYKLINYVFSRNCSTKISKESYIPCNSVSSVTPFEALDQSIMNAFEILVKVGGYIILFSIFARIMLLFHFIPLTLQFFLIGFLEITTGAAAISLTTFPFLQKIVLINGLTAFGGLSSLAQTYSVLIHSGLSIKTYFIYKLINGTIACLLTLLFINIL